MGDGGVVLHRSVEIRVCAPPPRMKVMRSSTNRLVWSGTPKVPAALVVVIVVIPPGNGLPRRTKVLPTRTPAVSAVLFASRPSISVNGPSQIAFQTVGIPRHLGAAAPWRMAGWWADAPTITVCGSGPCSMGNNLEAHRGNSRVNITHSFSIMRCNAPPQISVDAGWPLCYTACHDHTARPVDAAPTTARPRLVARSAGELSLHPPRRPC